MMPTTTATILAAGVGSRLRPLTDSMPKCLVPVGGRPILGWQLDALRAADVGPVTVVAGYRAGDVEQFCRGYGDAVKVVVNPEYETTNNMVSLRMAIDRAEPMPMVVCNGDVVFDPEIAIRLVSEPAPNLVAVEPGRYIAESMKVTIDGSGRVSGLSKAITPVDAYGVSIDLYRFSVAGQSAICRRADWYIETAGATNLWAEVAIQAALTDERFMPLDIRRRPWIEIDNLDDLAEAERVFVRSDAR